MAHMHQRVASQHIYYKKGKVIAMRRIMLILMAIAVMFGGAVIVPATATAEGGYVVKFVRDKGNCYAGTFVIVGMPGNHRVELSTGWGPPKPYGGFNYTGKGGTSPNVWRKHFSVSDIGGRVHKGKFLMYSSFRDKRNVPWGGADINVPACK